MVNKNILENTIEYIKQFFQSDFSGHDHFHSMRVYKTACCIAEKEHADLFVVQLAALLHDVDDFKLSRATCEHKDNARKFMSSQGVSSETIEEVCRIIASISYVGNDSVTPDTIEGKCVQDADRIDAIGAIGIARAFSFGGNHNRLMYDPDEKPNLNMSKEEYQNSKSTTINHFYEKLFKLEGLMNTDTAKSIAKQREKYMEGFVERFLAEWAGIQ